MDNLREDFPSSIKRFRVHRVMRKISNTSSAPMPLAILSFVSFLFKVSCGGFFLVPAVIIT